MTTQARNQTAPANHSFGQWEKLSKPDLDFVVRCQEVLEETRLELDTLSLLLPRMSLEMSLKTQHRIQRLLSVHLSDYLLCIGFMISRMRETDSVEPDYCDRLSRYIGCHDWERIAQPLFSVSVIVTTSLPSSKGVYLPTDLIDAVTKLCLKLSILTELLRKRPGPISRRLIDTIQMEAASLMAMHC